MAIDWLILEKIQQIFGSGFGDWFMPRITVLGNAGIIWIIRRCNAYIKKIP